MNVCKKSKRRKKYIDNVETKENNKMKISTLIKIARDMKTESIISVFIVSSNEHTSSDVSLSEM